MSVSLFIRRSMAACPAMVGATLIAFVLGVIAPGDPATEALRQGPYDQPDPAAVAALRRQWGLDAPLPVRYLVWLGRVAQGDWGVSYFSRRPVLHDLLERLPATLLLACASTALAALVGVGAGIVCALLAGHWLDGLLRVASVLLASLPGFVTGVLLIALFAEALRLLPTSGYGTPRHLVLPVIALSIGEAARLLRLTRAQLLDVLAQDFMRTARAKGLRERAIVVRHALPNVARPMLALTGLRFAGMLLAIAGLSFLGLGVQPPTPDWGTLLNDARPYLRSAPHLAIAPAACVLAVSLGANLLADALLHPSHRFQHGRNR